MLLNIVVFVLIFLVAGYLATQGMLSALLALATATFSSILAMALLEPLEGIIGGWRPDYARGVTFLLLFFLAFSITRIVADICVPKNIKLSVMINRIAGGSIGFFVGLVVVGTLLIGVEMLPVARAPLGFERFPGGNYMQAVDSDGKPILGQVAKPSNVLLAPDRFVLTLWNGASGRSLGGARAFASVHPDLSIESYGYRNQVAGALRTLPADLMQVKEAWKSAEAVVKDEQGIEHKADNGKALVMVRTDISKGDKPPHMSDDGDNMLRISASEVRLITKQGHQYYPIGYMEQGQHFIPLTLDTGYVLDDYVKGANAVDDWIFQVPAEETPVWIEVKQLARAELTLKDKQTPALAASAYPAHQYFKDLSTLTVTFDTKRELKAGRVIVLRPDNQRSDIPTTAISAAHNHVLQCDKDMQNNAGGWSDKGAPGVPPAATLIGAERVGETMLNDLDDAPINWSGLVTLLLLGQVDSNGDHNLRLEPDYFDNTFVPMLTSTRKGSLIVASGSADSSGKVVIPKISPGKHVVICTELVAKNGAERGYFVWVREMNFGEPQLDSKGNPVKDKDGNPVVKTASQITMSESSGESPAFKLDLDEKNP